MDDWKQVLFRKLTSRKLWMALAAFVSLLLTALGSPEESASKASALIMAGASVVAYIVGEGLADSKNPPDQADPEEKEAD